MYEKKEISGYKRASLGGGLTFMTDRALWMEFKGTGMQLAGFRGWLRCLGVPVILVGRERLVRVQSFRLALLAISRIGEQDFAAPGCQMLRVGNAHDRKKYKLVLDPEQYRKDMKQLIAELLYSKSTTGHRLTYETAKLASEAATKLLWVAMRTLPARAQKDADRRSIGRMAVLAPDAVSKVMEEAGLGGWEDDRS